MTKSTFCHPDLVPAESVEARHERMQRTVNRRDLVHVP